MVATSCHARADIKGSDDNLRPRQELLINYINIHYLISELSSVRGLSVKPIAVTYIPQKVEMHFPIPSFLNLCEWKGAARRYKFGGGQ
jgi:hypothetical protein